MKRFIEDQYCRRSGLPKSEEKKESKELLMKIKKGLD